MEFDEFIRLIEQSINESQMPHGYSHRFREADVDAASLEALRWAVDYMPSESEEQSERWGPFAPMLETQDSVYPPPLDSVSDAYLQIWATGYESASHPVLRARLAQLLWVTRYGPSPHEFAIAAITDLLNASASDHRDLDRVNYAAGALELAVVLNNQPLISLAVDRLLVLAREHLEVATDEPAAGVAIRILTPLAYLRSDFRPPELRDLIEDTAALYIGNAFGYGPILQLLEPIVADDEAALASVRQRIVDEQIARARGGEGIVRVGEYQRALELAQSFNMGEVVTEIRRELQDLQVSGDFSTISHEVQLERDEIDRVVSEVVADDNLEGALIRLGSWGPLSGDYNATVSMVDQSMQNSIRFLVTRITLDDQDNVLHRATTPDEHRYVEIGHLQHWSMLSHALFILEMLDGIEERYDPTPDELVAHFSGSPFIRDGLAQALAKGFSHYWSGDYDSAVMVVTPRIEAILREIARSVGIVIFIEQRGKIPGHYRALGQVLEAILNQLSDDFWLVGWIRYLRAALSDPMSLNLRNRSAHGLSDEFSQHEAAIALHILCFLRLIEIPGADASA